MFTWSVRVGCSFPACRGESVKYQTSLIFLPPLPTLVSDPNFIHLATGLSVIQVFHWSRPVGNYAFLESRDQCLHGRLGSVVVSRTVGESR